PRKYVFSDPSGRVEEKHAGRHRIDEIEDAHNDLRNLSDICHSGIARLLAD
ncbi:MAG: hypothetical protein QOI14_1217, partial [Actinomycetota bacterium]|nr:hypothetical protein [Actinomycetota bacterium]